MSTVPTDSPTTLEGLKARYLADLEENIEPQYRPQWLEGFDQARLAKLTRNYCSKGGYTEAPKGTFVLDLGTRRDSTSHTFYVPAKPRPVRAPETIRGTTFKNGVTTEFTFVVTGKRFVLSSAPSSWLKAEKEET